MRGLSTIPELPEVESVRRSLENKLVGRTFVKTTVNLDKGVKQQDPETFVKRIKGLTVENLKRRGKYIIADLKNNEHKELEHYQLIVHLGMTGACFNVHNLDELEDKWRKHAHVVLDLDNGTKLVYCDIRRFGGLRVFNQAEKQAKMGGLVKMGPEPFDDDAEEIFLKNVKKKFYRTEKQEDGSKVKVPIVIKEAILDQNVLAGVGNIYASESLWLSKINPHTPVVDLNEEQLRTVFRNARDVMAFSISVGGSSINDYVDGEGKQGSMQNYLKAYGQTNCPDCGTEIVKTEVKGRSTFHCPKCQH